MVREGGGACEARRDKRWSDAINSLECMMRKREDLTHFPLPVRLAGALPLPGPEKIATSRQSTAAACAGWGGGGGAAPPARRSASLDGRGVGGAAAVAVALLVPPAAPAAERGVRVSASPEPVPKRGRTFLSPFGGTLKLHRGDGANCGEKGGVGSWLASCGRWRRCGCGCRRCG